MTTHQLFPIYEADTPKFLVSTNKSIDDLEVNTYLASNREESAKPSYAYYKPTWVLYMFKIITTKGSF